MGSRCRWESLPVHHDGIRFHDLAAEHSQAQANSFVNETGVPTLRFSKQRRQVNLLNRLPSHLFLFLFSFVRLSKVRGKTRRICYPQMTRRYCSLLLKQEWRRNKAEYGRSWWAVRSFSLDEGKTIAQARTLWKGHDLLYSWWRIHLPCWILDWWATICNAHWYV